jgi:hypothetical protein
MAAALVVTQALSACAGDADDPRWQTGQERLVEDVWTISDASDFNDDGNSDLLWNDTGKSKMVVWLMRSTDVLSPTAPISGPPGDGWSAVWAADFNADGMTDVRWYNAKTNETSISLMAGTELLLPGPIFPGPAGDGWKRAVPSDFNDDGMTDLLWYHTVTHAIEVWLINGTELLLPGPEIPSPLGQDWITDCAGDFNADGMGDVLWHNPTTGSISVGLMNATVPLLQGPVIPGPSGVGWHVFLTPDFNADGMADVLWFNAMTGAMAVWLMSGTELLLPGPEIPGPSGDGWNLAMVGDFNGDGLLDVVWSNTATNEFAVWLMTGTEVLLRGAETPGPSGP